MCVCIDEIRVMFYWNVGCIGKLFDSGKYLVGVLW